MAYGREDSPSSGKPQGSNLGGPSRSGAGGAGGTRRSSDGTQRESAGSVASSSRAGAGPQRSTTGGGNQGSGNYGRSDSPSSGRPQGSNLGGGRQGGAGMGFQGGGKMGALSGQHIAGVSRPGSYAGPKGARALENQALAAAHGPYGHFTDPAEQAMQRLQARGWSPTVAAGIAGNLNVESAGFNPFAAGDIRKGVPTAAGLGQHRFERRAALEEEAGPFAGYNPATKTFTTGPTFNQQLDFIDRELQGLTPNRDRKAMRAGKAFTANPNMSVAEAGGLFAKDYERPSKAAFRDTLGQRTAMNVLGGGSPGLTQIAGRPPSPNIQPAGFTTQMPRAKPDLRGLPMGMPRAKPDIRGMAVGIPREKPAPPAPTYAQMSPASISAFAAPRTAIPQSIFASPATAYGMPRAKPFGGGGLAQLGRASRGRKRK